MTITIKPSQAVKKPDFHATIHTKVSAKAAFDKINDVPAWWSKNFQGSAKKLNDIYTIRFGDIWKMFKVVEFVPNKKAVWEVTDCHMPFLADQQEWKGTKLVWEISEQKDSTQIDFTHAGLTPEIECYALCNKGWTFFIHESLLKLLNENQGDPHDE